jgi:predicted dehydrogenase
MKQVVQNFRTGELLIEDLPPPALRPGGCLVRTAFSLISAGTERATIQTAKSSLAGKAIERPDLVRQVIETFKREGLRSTYQKVKSRLNRIRPLGYSASGVVIAIGEGAEEFKIGDRVACAGAGYASHAEINFVPKNLCVRVPDEVPLDAACYTTVGAIALHGLRQSEASLGETVAVIGLGLIGQLVVQMLRAGGCRVIGIDPDPDARALAERSGADAVADAEQARALVTDLTRGQGADSVIIAAATKSNEPVELAADVARDRARIVILGQVSMNLPRHSFYAKELELRLARSYGPGRYDPQYEEKGNDYPIGYVRWTERRNMEAFLRLMADGRVNVKSLTTHRFSIDRALEAYELILAGRQKSGFRCGVILEYPQAEAGPAEVITSKRAEPATADQLGVAFIGAGNFARGVLLPIIRRARGVQLRGVATATGTSAKSALAQFGFAYATTDYRQILEDPQTHCVFIATRHNLHARLAAEALRSRKAVFVEKPLAVTEDELREVLKAARESGSMLFVGFNRRFAPLARRIKSLLGARAGPMALLYRVNAGPLPPEHWAHDPSEGGGRIIGEVCHFIDFAQYMTDSLPGSVFAISVRREPSGATVDDSAAISISMRDGSIVSVLYAAGGDARAAKEKIEIFCGGRIAIIDDFKIGQILSGGRQEQIGRGAQDKGHADQLAAFFQAVRSGQPPISLESLAATTLATFAIIESIRSGSSLEVGLESLML